MLYINTQKSQKPLKRAHIDIVLRLKIQTNFPSDYCRQSKKLSGFLIKPPCMRHRGLDHTHNDLAWRRTGYFLWRHLQGCAHPCSTIQCTGFVFRTGRLLQGGLFRSSQSTSPICQVTADSCRSCPRAGVGSQAR